MNPTLSTYLNNNQAAPPSKKTISEMLPYYSDFWGSPLAPHQPGQQLWGKIKQYYQTIYELLGANEEDDTFILTSSGAEAINHVIQSVYLNTTKKSGKNHFLTASTDEAPAILSTSKLAEFGCIAKMLPVTQEGIITPKILTESITPRTALLSLSLSNGLTGIMQPIKEISKICIDRRILLHLDISHSLGKVPLDLNETGAHFITFNGEALHAPVGTGGLLVRNKEKISPMILCGSDHSRYRGGNLNVPALVGLTTALQEMVENMDFLGTEISRLRNKLEKKLLSAIPDSSVLFKGQERLPNCTTLIFPKICNEALLYLLNQKKIYATIGGGSFQQLNRQLLSSGINETVANGSISFALSRYTTEEAIEKTIEETIVSVKQLQESSLYFFNFQEA